MQELHLLDIRTYMLQRIARSINLFVQVTWSRDRKLILVIWHPNTSYWSASDQRYEVYSSSGSPLASFQDPDIDLIRQWRICLAAELP